MLVVQRIRTSLACFLLLADLFLRTALSLRISRSNQTQSMTAICREFVESRVIAKSSSPADIFNDLALSKEFSSSQRIYVKHFAFQTPNFPSLYPNNVDCIKFIKAPSSNQCVVLRIQTPFEVEPNSLCTLDFLEVRDGAFGFSPLIGRFCSKMAPPDDVDIRSTGQYMWLRFRSDNTLQHKGFKALYYFSNSSYDVSTNQQTPVPESTILRRMQKFQLGANEEHQLGTANVLKMLEYLSIEQSQQPLEAVLDIRSPPDTHMMLHIHHFQVPRLAAWSCEPDQLKNLSTLGYCRPQASSLGMRSDAFSKTRLSLGTTKELTPAIADPVSMINGRMTFMELYTGNTVAQSVPPCPDVHRFCIWSINEDNPASSDILITDSRLIIRLVVASPTAHWSTRTAATDGPKVEQSGQDDATSNHSLDHHTESLPSAKLDVTTVLPNFTFTITVISKNNGNFSKKIVDPVEEEESVVDMKELQAQEKRAQEQADMEKHSAIIGSISLVLLLVTGICMMFAIRRKRKEAINHVIEIKPEISLEIPVPQMNRNGSAGVPAAKPSPTVPKVIPSKWMKTNDNGDEEDDLVEDLTTSGDPLLGRKSEKNGTGVMANHIGFTSANNTNTTPWQQQKNPKSAVVSAKDPPGSISRGLDSAGGGGLGRGAAGRIRAKGNNNNKRSDLPDRQRAELWRSDMELLSTTHPSSQRLDLFNQNLGGRGNAKLIRGESTQTADGGQGYRWDYKKYPSQHQLPPQVQQRNYLQKQKTSSTDIGDSPGGLHVPNCRLMGRVRSLGNNLRLQDSRDFIEYDSSSQSPSSTISPTSSSDYRVPRHRAAQRSQPVTGEHKYVNACVMQHGAGGRRNMKQFSQLSKAFRSMPDVNGAAYKPPVTCGHKDCRDFYRLQAFRWEMLQQEKRDYLPAPPKRRRTGEKQISGSISSCGQDRSISGGVGSTTVCGAATNIRVETVKAPKDPWRLMDDSPKRGGFLVADRPRGNLSKEREFELSSSEAYSTGDNRTSHRQTRGYENAPLPLADAYSVHGLSDAISVESDSSSVTQSDLSELDSIDEECCHSASVESYPPPPLRNPAPLTHVGSVISGISSLSNKEVPIFRWGVGGADSSTVPPDPPSSSSRSKKPTPNCLFYEYEA